MQTLGLRIIYNKQTGKILNGTLDERFDAGLTPELASELRPSIENIGILDLPYGDTRLKDVCRFHIDVMTNSIVIDEKIIPQPTPEELKIQELENELLVASGVI